MSTSWAKPHPEGTVLAVKAQPGSRKEGILGLVAARLKVGVHDPPEKGKANQALIAVLAEALEVKRGDVVLLAGTASSQKRFLIRGLSPTEVASRLPVTDSGNG